MGQYLAIDLGAESGRAILGGLFDGKLAIDELHRFPNTPVREPGGLYWDTPRLWHEIQRGIDIAVAERRIALDGIGVDTWGVDFALLGADGALLEKPLPLSRLPHQRHDGTTVPDRAARGRFRVHGHPDDADQHADPALRDEAGESRRRSNPRGVCCTCPTCSITG